MKTIASTKSFYKVLLTISSILMLTACEKNEKAQTFDDVFDISGVVALNKSIDNCTSVASLTSLVRDLNLDVPAKMSSSNLDDMCKALEKNLELSVEETDRLLKNDPEALLSVLTRFGELPAEFGDKNMDFSELENSKMKDYLLKQKEEPGINYYPDDYYSAIQAYRDYIEKCVIQPLKHIREIELKSQDQLPEGAHFEYYVLIAMNHNWTMWWSYWRCGNNIYKIKHKGGGNHH